MEAEQREAAAVPGEPPGAGPVPSLPPVVLERLSRRTARWTAWAEAHPRRAWALALLLVLAPVAWEASSWPRLDYPGAMWKHTPKGIDVEWAQAAAAKAGWKELLGYWYGPQIPVGGAVYWRPLPSWLFVGQYRLFGRNDRPWHWLSIALHLAVVLLLAWAVATWLEGPLLRRLGAGVLAALLVGAPGLADRSIQFWTIGWWPAQPELLSLLFGLLLLGFTALHCRTGERRWALLAPPMLVLSLCCKEMGYVAGVGACLMLLRQPRARGLLCALAATGLLLWLYRRWVLHGGTTPAPSAKNLARFWQDVWPPGMDLRALLEPTLLWMGGLPLLLGLGAAWALRGRFGWGGGLVAGMVLAGCAGTLLVGWGAFSAAAGALLFAGVAVLLIASLARLTPCWPVGELIGVYLLCVWMSSHFARVYGWYRFWPSVFGCVLSALAIVHLAEKSLEALRARPGLTPPPRRETCPAFQEDPAERNP